MSEKKFYCKEKVNCDHRDTETQECNLGKEPCDFKTTKKPNGKKKSRWKRW